MDFPVEKRESIDAYEDWIMDLEWLQKDGYTVIIYNNEYFMNEDPYYKSIIMDGFISDILPWWQEDIKYFSGGLEPKPFNVYLVD